MVTAMRAARDAGIVRELSSRSRSSSPRFARLPAVVVCSLHLFQLTVQSFNISC